VTPPQVRHPQACGAGGGSDVLDRLDFLGLRQDSIQVDRPAGPDGGQRVRQEFQGRVREIQDDPVDGRDLP